MAIAPDLTERDLGIAEVPLRARGVELLGELQGSGYRRAPSLVRRGDGRTIQLTPLLYTVLEEVDGRRDLAGVAAAVSDRIGRRAEADDVRFLLEEKLRPLGLLRAHDGTEPVVEKSNPLLALRCKVVLSSPRVTGAVSAPLAVLFWPPVVVLVVAGFVAMTTWLLFSEGLAGSARQLLYSPPLLVLTFALTLLSAGFHELGHGAACRYGGGRPGAMGAGLYLVWPAFYTDVSDSYRLSRRGRLRTDLGGLYFNMIFALATFGAWALTGVDALLVVVPLQLLQMAHQLLPFVRLDGYLILSDLTGVPDLFARIKPTLLSMVPWRARDPRAAALKPWVRVVVTLWVVAVIPLLGLGLTMLVMTLPRFAATAWDSAALQWRDVVGTDDLWTRVAGSLSIAALVLPVLSSTYLLARVGRRLLSVPTVRHAAVPAACVLAWLWWPNGEYEAIHARERGRVQDTARAVLDLPTGRPALTESRAATLTPLRQPASATPMPPLDAPIVAPTSTTAPTSTSSSSSSTSSSSTTTAPTTTSTSSPSTTSTTGSTTSTTASSSTTTTTAPSSTTTTTEATP